MNVSQTAWRVVAEGLLAPDESSANALLAALLQESENLWPQIIWVAGANVVTPALWDGLRRKNLADLIPEDAARYLNALYEMNRTRNAALEAQLDEILSALNAGGITVCLLKGAAYLKTGVYPDAGVRILSDLDLLIAGDQLLDTQRILSRLGYNPLSDIDKDYSEHHHLPPLFRRGEFGSVEVHHEPVYFEAQRCLRAQEVWDNSVEHCEGGVHYRVPDPTHSSLLAFLHSEVVDRNLKMFFVSLRSLQDLVALTSAYGELIDWPEIYVCLQRYGHGCVFRDFLYLAERLAEIRPLPEVRFGPLSRLRYLSCRLVLRFSAVQPWVLRLDALSSCRIRARYGYDQTIVSRSLNRIRLIGSFIWRRVKKVDVPDLT